MSSPPKPWERNGQTMSASSLTTVMPSAVAQASSSLTVPAVPPRPTTLASSTLSSPYSSLQSSYGLSPYSRFGTNYSGIGSYGGFGNLGGMYNGYGNMGYGGMGSYGGYGGIGMMGGYGGMGMMGPNGLPMDPSGPSLTQTLESTTQHAFTLLHSIVQTFGGVAQMLESTFMATHSSFFAMVGVIDQFNQLRNALGSVLGLFGLLKWLKDLLTGRSSTSSQGSREMQKDFRNFVNGRPVNGPINPSPKASKKLIAIFLVAIFGIPYLMTKLIKVLAARAAAQRELGGVLAQQSGLGPLDPASLTFARALYPFNASSPAELSLKEDEVVAIMGKLDPMTGTEIDPRVEVESDWWRGRTREGREGWFPRKWVQVLEKRVPKQVE